MAAANVLTLTTTNFKQEVLSSTVPVLVDFWAEWCGPCKMLAPTIDELATEYGEKVKFGKVNIDNDQDLAVQFNIGSIPTILLFKGGQIAGQIVGMGPKKKFKDAIDKLL
ncbi:MAG TPA: thioredoxin [Verrucomicrobiales bacterium]|nr:thioredoxin [Verrucomicrobiales bacterium]